jgi:hypothetical protein
LPNEEEGRDPYRVDELLRRLNELRELDRERQSHAPGSPAFEAASDEVTRRSGELMNDFHEAARRERPRRMRVPDVETSTNGHGPKSTSAS